jgi:predicted dithiol-disulfide oxidoreductase (DUF899 family)
MEITTNRCSRSKVIILRLSRAPGKLGGTWNFIEMTGCGRGQGVGYTWVQSHFGVDGNGASERIISKYGVH